MKNSEVYRKYFGTTWGRFYSAEQRARLLELFTATQGALSADGNIPQEIKHAVARIESYRPTGLIECRNLILISTVQEEDEDMMTALYVLRDRMENCRNDRERVFVTARDWHLAVYDERHPMLWDQAFLAYGEGDCRRAIALLEKQEESLDTVECLAVLYARQGDAEKAYYSVGRLLYLFRARLHLAPPVWALAEADRLASLLAPEAKEALDRRIGCGGTGGKHPMGFTA